MHILETIASMALFGFDHWVHLIVFIASFVESLPVIGLFVPGMFIVVAGGVMAKIGTLHIGGIIFAAALGAILSDFVGYFLGRRYGTAVLERYGKYFFFHKRHFEATERLMHGHAGKALIIGRFNSITRCFGPFIAGTMHISLGRFLIFNLVGGVLWATTFVLVGYLFSHSYEIVAHAVGRYVTISIFVGVGMVLLYRFIEARKHIFAKFHLYTLALNIVMALIFARILEGVISIGHLTHLDTHAHILVPSFVGTLPHTALSLYTGLTSIPMVIIFTLMGSFFFLTKKKWHELILLNVSIMGGGALVMFIKDLVERARPVGSLIEVNGYSFPSSHATMAIILALVCIYLAKDTFRTLRARRIFEVCILLSALLVGYSRIYFNVHWATDVLAGFALGTWWFTTTLLVMTFVREELFRRSHTCAVPDTPSQ